MRKGTMIGMLAATFVAAMAVGVVTAPAPAGAGGPCMFDPGSGQYKECAAASMGSCNHYTTTCEPKCMYDPSSRTYKQCAAPSMGKCNHYTSACTP